MIESSTTPEVVPSLYIVPGDGLSVIDPSDGSVLPKEGKRVRASGFWLRRVNDGSVKEAKPPVEAKPKAEAKPFVEVIPETKKDGGPDANS